MTHEQEDNELTYPIGYLDMQREASISKAHDLLDALIDSNARRDLIDMQLAKLRGKVDSERNSLRAQLENACASQADTDAFLMSKVEKLQSEKKELWKLLDEARGLLCEYSLGRLDPRHYVVDLSNRIDAIRAFKEGAQ